MRTKHWHTTDRLKKAFKVLDVDGSGQLEIQEVALSLGDDNLANEIIYAKMTGQCYDFNIREVVNSGCIVIFNSECNEADLASLCRLHCTIDILGIQRATAMKEAARR